MKKYVPTTFLAERYIVFIQKYFLLNYGMKISRANTAAFAMHTTQLVPRDTTAMIRDIASKTYSKKTIPLETNNVRRLKELVKRDYDSCGGRLSIMLTAILAVRASTLKAGPLMKPALHVAGRLTSASPHLIQAGEAVLSGTKLLAGISDRGQNPLDAENISRDVEKKILSHRTSALDMSSSTSPESRPHRQESRHRREQA